MEIVSPIENIEDDKHQREQEPGDDINHQRPVALDFLPPLSDPGKQDS